MTDRSAAKRVRIFPGNQRRQSNKTDQVQPVISWDPQAAIFGIQNMQVI
jgi:hypothetical protein